MSTGISIIVPAHNEETVIGACLASLAQQTHEGPLDVVVVENGCADATADVARSYTEALRSRGYELRVVTPPPTSRPAKFEALNAGDAAAAFAHRVYVDADVVLGPTAVAAIHGAFVDGVLFCSPRLRFDAFGYLARAYGRVWSALPYVRDDVIGAGVYAVHADGRARWGRFPDVMSDDKFARMQFSPGERVVLRHAWFRITLPCGMRELVVVRARWLRGNRELAHRFPALAGPDHGRLRRAVAHLARTPATWRDVPAVAAIYGCAEVLAAYQWRRRSVAWQPAVRARALRKAGR